jgi:eukaryotic-like serine/threonine-protein kinase
LRLSLEARQPRGIVGERGRNEWSGDGRFLTYWTGGPSSGDLKLDIAGHGSERKIGRLLDSQFVERGGSFSPDGRWIAYASNETSQYEVYVRAFDS